MDEIKLRNQLDTIRSNLHLFDTIVNIDYDKSSDKETQYYITNNQANLVKDLFKLFERLNWQVALNSYKQLEYSKDEPIDTRKCGTPVKVCPCDEKYGKKNLFWNTDRRYTTMS